MASAGSGYKLSLGADGPPGAYQDFDRTDLFFVIGANMADCHPILFLRMMDRVKAVRLIVVDPRRTTTAEKASLFIQIAPGTDLALLNGLLYLIVENGHTDMAFIAGFTEAGRLMPIFWRLHAEMSPAITGLPEADIRQAAAWIGRRLRIMGWTMGLNQSTHGTWNTNAICNLHLATGKICRPGSGPFSSPASRTPWAGAKWAMGPGLPGQRTCLWKIAVFETLWQLPPARCARRRGTVAMFQHMRAGQIKACWIICTNPVATMPNRAEAAIAGLQAAELVHHPGLLSPGHRDQTCTPTSCCPARALGGSRRA